MNSLVRIGREIFIKSENSLVNLRHVKSVQDKDKKITFYIGVLHTAEITEKDGKEEYEKVKKVLGFK